MKLEPWQHATAAAALTLTVLTGLWLLLALPTSLVRHANAERIDLLERQLISYRAAEQSILTIENEIAALEAESRNADLFLPGSTPALAAAELQRTLKNIIESHDGHVVSSQPVIQDTGSAFPGITIKISMRGDIETLQNVLYDAAVAKPRLTIDNLIVQRQHVANRGQQQTAPRLDARFDVIAYLNRSPEGGP